MTCRPGHAPRHPDFEPGNSAALKSGTYSTRVVAQRAEEVRRELIAQHPGIDQPATAANLQLLANAMAREQLAHERIEQGDVTPRLVEAASAATRVAKEQLDALGIGPRARAELRGIEARTASDLADVLERAPAIVEAIRESFLELGADEQDLLDFQRVFTRKLAQIEGGE